MSGGPGYCVHNWLKDISGCGRMFQTGSNFGYCSHSLVLSTTITLACLQGEEQAPCHPRGDWILLGRMTYRSSCAVFIAGRLPCLRSSSVLWNIGRLYYTLPSTEVSDYIFFFLFFGKQSEVRLKKKKIWYLVLFLQRCHDAHVPSNNSHCSLDGWLINILSHSINICFVIDKANICRMRRKK